MDFPNKLRNLRIQRGLTQMDLAKGLGTSQASITSWENGRREPDFETIRRIADYFRVPMMSLLPSSDSVDDGFVRTIAESMERNPKLRELFNKAQYLSDSDLDAVIGVINAIRSKL